MENSRKHFKRLYRSRAERVIFGVCGGFGQYFGIDPVIIRALFLALLFGAGFGVLLYLILALITPLEPGQ